MAWYNFQDFTLTTEIVRYNNGLVSLDTTHFNYFFCSFLEKHRIFQNECQEMISIRLSVLPYYGGKVLQGRAQEEAPLGRGMWPKIEMKSGDVTKCQG